MSNEILVKKTANFDMILLGDLMKKHRKLKIKNIVILIVSILILIFLFLIFRSHNTVIKDKEKTSFKEEVNEFQKLKYYISKNQKRYENYYNTHPETDIQDVIAIVNVSADKTAYEESKEADLSKGITVLVNKYNSLAEDYEPKDMQEMTSTYAYAGRKILPEVNEAFIKMYKDALKDDIKLYVVSAFRSYQYQSQLYTNYIATYGEEYANTVSARPGYSEHQTGLALDILSDNVEMSEFKDTKAYSWLKDNAYKYGFIMRYPEGKEYLTGYAFEAWHYRYLGTDLAQKVYDEGITYDEYYAYYLDN